jgi:hypothetical protein
MFTLLSLITSIKDYVEVVHKLIETDSNFSLTSYYDFGSIFTFIILTSKNFFQNFLTFQWFQNFWSIPTIVPDVASSIISEISVFDGSFKNTQTFLESPFSYGNQNFFIYCLEKFTIGFLNSLFLCFPTSIAHVITLRRFVMQGLEAGFLSGLGTIVGNIVWIGTILFGFRFFVIPWLSLDLFRYCVGFFLIVKYMWDSSRERRMVLEDFSKYKIFFLTFLLSFTEQITLYPFLSNLSFGSDSTLLETFPTESFSQFTFVHCCYLLGLLLGSLSFLQLTCWFWENPAFQIYMWFLSSFQITKNISSKFVNFLFLYVTMICAIANFSYFGLDYTLTNPLGFVHEDRLFEQKAFLETAFLNTKASDRNTRRNRGRHGRRERWKRRIRKYRTFDASLYDQGIYDLFTIEDLNYGFDRFWLRRKIRNHRVRFRFFPGPWMRNFKKQLSRPRLESFLGPRVEFFRILFEQAYHPEFHEFSSHAGKVSSSNLIEEGQQGKREQSKGILVLSQSRQGNSVNENWWKFSSEGSQGDKKNSETSETLSKTGKNFQIFQNIGNKNFISWNIQGAKKQKLFKEHSVFRKFTRKVQSRLKKAKIETEIQNLQLSSENSKTHLKPIFSKTWKNFANFENRKDSLVYSTENFSKDLNSSSIFKKSEDNFYFQRFYKKFFAQSNNKAKTNISKKDLFVQRYKKFLMNSDSSFQITKNNDKISAFPKTIFFSATESSTISSNLQNEIFHESLKKTNFPSPLALKTNSEDKSLTNVKNESFYRPLTLLHPLQFYFQKEQALKRKFQFYGVKLFRNYSVENNGPYFRVLMKRFFYHYKPSLRWERTLRVASTRRARRKSSRIPKKLNLQKNTQILAKENFVQSLESENINLSSDITNPTHFYSLVEKRASRYRFQIYKDVLQHWYYSPFNRLLLKLDIDSFIRRQPNSYFLTKNDEKFLHLKRQLLSEYYETLRWYTSMENYSTMKNQIGGTKSLSSRTYNQQFAGTLKKIRHLFNISPSFRANTVLKFDQPLYNDYTINKKDENFFAQSILHEELFSSRADKNFFIGSREKGENNFQEGMTSSNPQNLVNQSLLILRNYLATATQLRQQYIENLVKEKNYWELSRFLFRGQKIRGVRPITNETDFLNQEKDFFFNKNEQKNFYEQFDPSVFKDEIWISLLKKCQKKLYDQEALKNYVSLKKEKYEIQKQRHEKYLKARLLRIQEAVLQNSEVFKNQKIQNILSDSQKKNIENFEKFSDGYPSSFKKAMKAGILFLLPEQSPPALDTADREKNSDFSNSQLQTISQNRVEKASSSLNSSKSTNEFFNSEKKVFLEKTNIRKNQFPMYSLISPTEKSFSPNTENTKTKSFIFRKNLRFLIKQQALQILKAEKKVQQNFKNSQKSKFFNFPTLLQSFYAQITQKTKQTLFALKNKIVRFQPDASLPFFGSGKRTKKNIEFWKKRENILLKRKKLRKTLKRLRNQKTQNEKILFENSDFFNPLTQQKSLKTENRQKTDKNFKKYISPNFSKTFFQERKLFGFFRTPVGGENHFNQTGREFQRKRTRLRRYSSFKGRGPIKKRTLREKFKRQLKSLKKYGKNQNSVLSQKEKERENKKVEFIQFLTQKASSQNRQGFAHDSYREVDRKFLKREDKQRKTRQIKNRTWKKKKQNFAQKRRKLRKRRRSTIAKIRVYNKKIYRILSRKEIQTWWWKTFLPHFQKTSEKTWQKQKNLQIQKQLFELSEKEIFHHAPPTTSQTVPTFEVDGGEKNSLLSSLQIGNKDLKPFALPESLKIREKLVQDNMLHFENSNKKDFDLHLNKEEQSSIAFHHDPRMGGEIQKYNSLSYEQKVQNQKEIFPIFEKVNNSIFVPEKTQQNFSPNQSNSPFFVSTNPLPFYAGWDNGVRKFVLTNRFLARNDSFSPSSSPFNELASPKENIFGTGGIQKKKEKFDFLQSPLQGMNAATTLYWQIPFTTYDPDQFFALGMDGFSPIGWRNFSLKHSKQTTKPILVKNFYSFSASNKQKTNQFQNENTENLYQKKFSVDLRLKISQQTFSTQNLFAKRKQEIGKNFEYRRILKKQKRLKKHPRPPVWFPSGSLSQQVLPVHYIYVFYKRSRLPRDRYIRRRLRSSFLKDQNSRQESSFAGQTQILDFTLRKRTKPRRKYHRKRFGDISEKNQFFKRRRKFRGFLNEKESNRPSSKLFVQTSTLGTKQEKRLLRNTDRTKQRRKIQDSKQPNENIRVRQLRRRVQRQVYRPVMRSRPRAGGFVWPGDYLRFESVKASPLQPSNIPTNKNETLVESDSLQNSTRKIRKKNRRTLQEWQIQPKRYFFEKHNLKVLKKRIEKSLNFENF